MSIWNKVLVGLILVASLAFFVLAARALKTHQYWQEAALKLEAELKAEQELEGQYIDGDGGTMGLRQAKLALHALMVDRGRVWRNCTPQRVQPGGNQGVTLSLTTDLPDPNGINVKTVLYIFEGKSVQDGGQYLGQFTVTAVAGKDLQLVPSKKLDARELQRLQNSQGPWSLYEIMPVDQHKIFAGLAEDEIEAMLPESTVDEYLADRRAAEAEATDPDAQQPRRQLRDYEVLFAEHHKRRSTWTDEMAAANRDLQYLQSALADAKQQEQFRRDEIDRLTQEKAEEARQGAAVAAHLQKLEAKLAEVLANVEELLASNQALAGEIARIQLEATRRIDQQTRRMAQATSGR